MIYHSTHSDYCFWHLILRRKKTPEYSCSPYIYYPISTQSPPNLTTQNSKIWQNLMFTFCVIQLAGWQNSIDNTSRKLFFTLQMKILFNVELKVLLSFKLCKKSHIDDQKTTKNHSEHKFLSFLSGSIHIFLAFLLAIFF